MVGLLLVVQVPNTRNVRCVTILLCPGNCFVLGFESLQDMVGVILDHKIVDLAAFLATFGPRLDVDGSHLLSPLLLNPCLPPAEWPLILPVTLPLAA
jgi:hypothetical protein